MSWLRSLMVERGGEVVFGECFVWCSMLLDLQRCSHCNAVSLQSSLRCPASHSSSRWARSNPKGFSDPSKAVIHLNRGLQKVCSSRLFYSLCGLPLQSHQYLYRHSSSSILYNSHLNCLRVLYFGLHTSYTRFHNDPKSSGEYGVLQPTLVSFLFASLRY